jgi:four helix bundle protein
MELEYARSFRDLLVYRRAFQVAKKIFEFSKLFPEEEKYALTSQIRRSSRSIGAQITEAWAKRKYERHFTSKLTDADGEQLETQHWTRIAFSCGYVEEAVARSVIATLEEIGRLLQGLIDKAETFVRSPEWRKRPFCTMALKPMIPWSSRTMITSDLLITDSLITDYSTPPPIANHHPKICLR